MSTPTMGVLIYVSGVIIGFCIARSIYKPAEEGDDE